MHKKRNALGKGLSALLDTRKKTEIELLELSTDKIQADPNQPRITFDTEELVNLSESMRSKGILQPLIVRRGKEDKYILVSGERRLKAAVMLNLGRVPVIVRDFSDTSALEVSLIENLQRQDLRPLERAAGFEMLVNEHSYSHEQIGAAIGKSRAYVANTLRLLKMCQEIRDALSQNLITEGHARALMIIKDRATQLKILNLAIKQSLSVRQVEVLAKGKAVLEKKDTQPLKVYHEIEERMSEKLSTKVKVTRGKRKGKIVIEFKSEQQLNDILGYFN